MSKAEIMLVMILFHDSGYCCLKHFYQEKVCRHMRHLFPNTVSHNRFVELGKEAVPLALFIKKVLLGKCSMAGSSDSSCIRYATNDLKRVLMSVSYRLLLRKRAIIETVNDELKNIAQVEQSRHRSFENFVVNLLSAIAAYCCFPKKPCINVARTIDTQPALF